MDTALVIVGGDPPSPSVGSRLPRDAIVVAADSGYDHARALGRNVDVLVGDLDSISVDGLRHARATGVDIDEHPAAKDQTDTELALARAVASGVSNIVGVYGGGDRPDHELATVMAFASPHLAEHRVELLWRDAVAVPCHGGCGPVRLTLQPGTTFSLLALFGDAMGVTVVGAQYPLTDATLAAASSRGVSNVATADQTTVSVGAGTVLAIIPHLSPEGPR